jgi:hypothetical protein
VVANVVVVADLDVVAADAVSDAVVAEDDDGAVRSLGTQPTASRLRPATRNTGQRMAGSVLG